MFDTDEFYAAVKAAGIAGYGNLSDEKQVEFCLAFSNMKLAAAMEKKVAAPRETPKVAAPRETPKVRFWREVDEQVIAAGETSVQFGEISDAWDRMDSMSRADFSILDVKSAADHIIGNRV